MPVVLHPAPAERVVAADARAALPEVRDHRSVGERHRSSSIRRSRSMPTGRSSPSTTTTRSAPAPTISEIALRTVVDCDAVGAPDSPSSGSSSTFASVRSASRRSARSSPTNCVDELVGGVREDRVGRVVLREHAALAQDRDPVAHRDRLVDVVRDEDDRLRDLAVQAPQLVLKPRARDRVEGAERLVHQQQRRVGGQRAREPDALPLPARELRRVPRPRRRGSSPTSSSSSSTRSRIRALRPAEESRDGGDVVADRHVREEADLLDHVADAAPQLDDGQIANRPPVDRDVAGVERDQPVDHLERRGLPAARRPDEHAERAGRDLERELVERRDVATRVLLADAVEHDLGGALHGAHAVAGFRCEADRSRPRRPGRR